MKYVSLIHALNLPCDLETCGDWHCSALRWDRPHLLESDTSLWGDYGIENGRVIPEHRGHWNVANHIRALLDLLYHRQYHVAQGMNKDYICNSKYDNELFEKVYQMRSLPYWDEIDRFMLREYLGKWKRYKEGASS